MFVATLGVVVGLIGLDQTASTAVSTLLGAIAGYLAGVRTPRDPGTDRRADR